MEKILKTIIATIFFPLLLDAKFAVRSYQELRSSEVVRQSHEESCGAASLATLINLLDFKILTEVEVVNLMSDNQEQNTDMVSFFELQNTALKLLYESKGYQIDRAIFEKITIPILVKIEDDPRFPHFVVVINHRGDFVTIFDPSYGKYVSSKDQFYNLWDRHKKGGYALILAPKNNIQREYKPNLPANKALFDNF